MFVLKMTLNAKKTSNSRLQVKMNSSLEITRREQILKNAVLHKLFFLATLLALKTNFRDTLSCWNC